MAKWKYVSKARKDNPAVKAGESYYWWKFRFGSKHYSRTEPKPSQLTQSRWGEVMVVEEDFDEQLYECGKTSELQSMIENCVGTLQDVAEDFEGSMDSLPENLQGSETANKIEERVEAINECVGSLESLDLVEPEDVDTGDLQDTDESQEQAALRINIERCEEEITWAEDPW